MTTLSVALCNHLPSGRAMASICHPGPVLARPRAARSSQETGQRPAAAAPVAAAERNAAARAPAPRFALPRACAPAPSSRRLPALQGRARRNRRVGGARATLRHALGLPHAPAACFPPCRSARRSAA
jgi:hypothetical protein